MPSKTATDRLLTVGEAADRLGSNDRFVRKLIAQKRIAHIKLAPGRNGPVRIRESVIDRYIEAGTVDPDE